MFGCGVWRSPGDGDMVTHIGDRLSLYATCQGVWGVGCRVWGWGARGDLVWDLSIERSSEIV